MKFIVRRLIFSSIIIIATAILILYSLRIFSQNNTNYKFIDIKSNLKTFKLNKNIFLLLSGLGTYILFDSIGKKYSSTKIYLNSNFDNEDKYFIQYESLFNEKNISDSRKEEIINLLESPNYKINTSVAQQERVEESIKQLESHSYKINTSVAQQEITEKGIVLPTFLTPAPFVSEKTEMSLNSVTTSDSEIKAQIIVANINSFDELENTTKTLKNSQVLVLNTDKLNEKDSEIASAFLSGIAYSFDGNKKVIAHNCFLFTPKTVKVSTYNLENSITHDLGVLPPFDTYNTLEENKDSEQINAEELEIKQEKDDDEDKGQRAEAV